MHANLRASRQISLFSEAPFDRFITGKAMAKGLAESQEGPSRVDLACSFCEAVIKEYWNILCAQRSLSRHIFEPPRLKCLKNRSALTLAHDLGQTVSEVPSAHAGYLIGTLYTAMLPEGLRASLGAYYTPPALVVQLMHNVTKAGFDWKEGRVLDLSCGGAAFLAPVARRIAQTFQGTEPRFILRQIIARVRGIEIDPFAAWLSQVLLECELMDICVAADIRLPSLITVGDALTTPVEPERYKLVIGNPPYGRIKLSAKKREKFKRSLYGHANLYGLFTDLALRWIQPGGFIAYVTPTSFLGGQYFKSLRKLLLKEAPPVIMDLITERSGVFEDVLQETMLTVYHHTGNDVKKNIDYRVNVNFLQPNGETSLPSVQKIGAFRLSYDTGEPWLLPRSMKHIKLLESATNNMPCRLSDYGYVINTGQLVWNRHKNQLKSKPAKGRMPLIWAESVTPSGDFKYSVTKRNHLPYIELRSCQKHLVTKKACVLVQRTTAKEQGRRLIAAILPEKFLKQHGGCVVENHLNIIRPVVNSSPVSMEAISALLNCKIVDSLFRCISGSVAVSAYELNAIPLPSPKQLVELEIMVQQNVGRDDINHAVAKIYGVFNE